MHYIAAMACLLTFASADARPPIDAIQNRLAAAKVNAAAVTILTDGELSQHYFGKATPDTSFRWGSITKTFTAITLLQAAQTHGVALDTPITEFVTDETIPANLTIEHLVELTAGMADLTRRAFDDNRPYTLKQALEVHRDSLAFRWPAGLQHSYSNATPGLSQLVIERLTDQSFHTAIRSLVWQPLGMQSASLAQQAELPGGFRPDGSEIPYWHMTFAAFGAMNAKMADMGRFVVALVEGGIGTDGTRIWSELSQTRLTRPKSGLASSVGLQHGYAAGVYTRIRNGRVWRTHGGDADGYRSRYAVLEDQRCGYVIVINSDQPRLLRQLEGLIETHLTMGLPSLEPPPTLALSVEDHRLSGTYYPSSTRFGVDTWQRGERSWVRITIEANQLVVHSDGRRIRLLKVAPNLFRREGDPIATIGFIENSSHQYMQGELGNYVKLPTTNACPIFLPQCHSFGAP